MKRSAAAAISELGRVFRTGAWALTISWEANAGLTIGLGGIAVVVGMLPAAVAITTRGLINAVAAALRGEGAVVEILLPWLALGFVVALVEAISPLVSRLLLQCLSDDLNLKVTSDALHHAAALDIGSLEDPQLRDTIESAQQDTPGAFARLITSLHAVCIDAVQVVLMAGILTYVEPLVLLVVCPFALPYLVVRWRTSKLRTSEDMAWTTKRRWTRYFVSHLTGQFAAAQTRLLGLASLFLAKFQALMTQLHDRDRTRYRGDFAAGAVFATLTTVAFYLLFIRVVVRAGHGALTIGDVAVFAGLSARLRLTLERLIWSLSSLADQAAWVANLRAFLATPSRMATGGGIVPATRRGDVELTDVSFTYPHSTIPAVSDVSIHIHPGEVLALVGENGAGKSTLVRLIARLYDPDRGRIRLDGVDLSDWPVADLQNCVAFLDQRFARYEATAADNIAYGDWRRLLERRDRIQEIAASAGVHDLIQAMPHGYDTVVGPMFGEHDLSAGQWQKLAIARALARDAVLLIVDEPTAHLDAAAEYELFCRLRALSRGRTTILISHRFATLGLADRIVVMERGRIAETGTHDELVAQGGVYARSYELHRRQTSRNGKD